ILGAVPAVIALVLRRMLPESARWLADRGRLAEANEVVTFLEEDTKRRGIALPPVPAIAVARPGRAPWSELFAPRYLGRTITVWCLWFCAYYVSFGLGSWLPTLYRTVFKLELSTALTYALITNVVGLIGTFTVAFFVDMTGRRAWFVLA